MTEGKHCSVCNTLLVGQAPVPATGHSESDWIVEKEATKTENGFKYISCLLCNEKIREEILYAIGSTDLAYKINTDGSTCTVTGIVTCKNTDIIIPEYIDNHKVVAIAEKAFAENTTIKSFTLPGTLESIGTRAFYGCTGITEFTIPTSVTSIGTQIFYKASNLKTVYYNGSYDNPTDNNAFLSVSSVEKIVFGSSVIPAYIAYNNTTLKTVVILEGVKGISQNAFEGCKNISSLTIPIASLI